MNKLLRSILCLIIAVQTCSFACGQDEMQLARLISDGMVLQQRSTVSIWGWTIPGKIVTVEAAWGSKAKAIADSSGKWITQLRTPEAGGPFRISVSDGISTVVVHDVLIGEVWVCSGQSNMDMPLEGWLPGDTIVNYKEEIQKADYPEIRMFNVAKDYSLKPLKDVQGSWMKCSPETVGEFSAVGYFFGRELIKNLNVPVGLIHSSFGASPAEAWVPAEDLLDFPRFCDLEEVIQETEANLENYNRWFEGLIDPGFTHGRRLEKFRDLVLCDSLYRYAEFDDSEWKTTDLPAQWESFGFGDYDGAIWFRKEFELASKEDDYTLELHLGNVQDVDECYLNGYKIGESYDELARKNERTYIIPDTLLEPGRNTLAIRVIDVWGKAGFLSPDEPLLIQNGQLVLDLRGSWKYLPTAQYLFWELLCFDEGAHNYENQPYLPFLVDQEAPSALYNAMLLPLIPYRVKGVIWYQGESNTDYPEEYNSLFPALIRRWQKDWQQDKLPFYFAQIAPLKNYDNDEGKNTAELREAQCMAQSLPNTGMAVLLDLGDKWRIHPGRKQEVGYRLALWALAKDYGFSDRACSGPQLKSAVFEQERAILSFDYIYGGLKLKVGDKDIFQIAGEEGEFLPAEVKIEGEKLVLWSDEVPHPTSVRYGFTNWVEPTLYNSHDLPASSFRTK